MIDIDIPDLDRPPPGKTVGMSARHDNPGNCTTGIPPSRPPRATQRKVEP
jgi:hypothetical protein